MHSQVDFHEGLNCLIGCCCFQVNTNGVISFLVQVSQYTPKTFPLDGNRRLVAPFWADVDTRKGGDVFYRETTDPNLLQQATDHVTSTYVDQQNFRATWLFIATWNEVAFFGASNSNLFKVGTLDLHYYFEKGGGGCVYNPTPHPYPQRFSKNFPKRIYCVVLKRLTLVEMLTRQLSLCE